MTRLRYVALGDSYTIGTSVRESDRWPNQLVRRLDERREGSDGGAAHGADGADALDLVGNLAANGYATADVIEDELPRLAALRPDFVSLLIGVNDVVRRVTPDTYRRNAMRILDDLLAKLPASRIVTVATPDYTVTPAGGSYGDPQQQAAGIVTNNVILRELAEARGITFVDIHDLSLLAAVDRTLVAGDGLHPSGAQYARWVDRIQPAVEALLDD